MSREDGFSIVEMMVATTVMLLVIGAALTTFQNAVRVNDTASQLADANQNLRAGTNQLVRDLLMAGRLIGTEGIPMPTGPGITFARPGPVALTFPLIADTDATLQLPSITTGYQLGPTINGSLTDMITIMTVDEFMPTVSTPPATAGAPTAIEGTIAPDGSFITFAAVSQWINGDLVADTPKIKVGDLVLYVGTSGKAIQTVTSIDTTLHRIYFAVGDSVNDFFRFNQANATNEVAGTGRPLSAVKQVGIIPAPSFGIAGPCAPAAPPPTQTSGTVWCSQVTLFKVLMITYYVDNTTTPGTPRLTRVLNHFPPQALAGVVEDLDLTYDLVDGVNNPTDVKGLPCVGGSAQCPGGTAGVTYDASLIRKVNIHVGVRSEVMSKPMQDYVRNHILTSVNVRSLAAVDRYPQ